MRKALTLIICGVLVAGILWAPAVWAEYPDKNVKLIIPYGPGGATDALFRIFIKYTEPYFGETIVPINMGGAGATKGSRFVKNAKPDGYTVLGSHDTIATSFYSGMADYSFDAFEPVCLLSATPNILTVNSNSPYKSTKEILAYAKAHPGKLTWAFSPGSTAYYFFVGLMKATGGNPDWFRQVPISGTGKQIKNLLGEHVDIIMANVTAALEYVKEGKLKFIASASSERLPQTQDVPTLKEEGIDFEFATNRGVFAPKGTPKDRVDILDAAFRKACSTDELKNKVKEMGSLITYKNSKDFKPFLDKLDAFYKNAMK